jgi:hypothetical protein
MAEPTATGAPAGVMAASTGCTEYFTPLFAPAESWTSNVSSNSENRSWVMMSPARPTSKRSGAANTRTSGAGTFMGRG